MKIKKKNFIILFLLCLILLFFIIISIILFNNKGIINDLIDKTYKLNMDENSTTLNLESKENDDVLLIFENNNGIKQITAPNGLIIYADGKKKVAMDYQVEANTTYNFETISMSDSVSYSSFTTPTSHIELTRLDFDIDLEVARSRIRKELNKNMIATNFIDLKLGDLDNLVSGSVNLSEAVNSWRTIGAPTWAVTSDGQQIYSSVPGGNGWPNWWGTGLINPNEKAFKINSFALDFTLASSGYLHEGPCFFVTQNDDGTLNGYFFNVSMHTVYSGVYVCCLWKFDHYNLNQSFSSGINSFMWCAPYHGNGNMSRWTPGGGASYGNNSFTCLAQWTGYANGQYHVVAKDGNITIELDGNTVVDINDTTYTEGTYGFWGNNCEQRDSMYIKDVSIRTFVIPTLEELLQDITWSNDINNIIINFSNSNEVSLDNTSTVDTFNNYGINYLAISTEENKSSIESFIEKINNKGEYIDNTNYDDYMQKIIDYLLNILS